MACIAVRHRYAAARENLREEYGEGESEPLHTRRGARQLSPGGIDEAHLVGLACLLMQRCHRGAVYHGRAWLDSPSSVTWLSMTSLPRYPPSDPDRDPDPERAHGLRWRTLAPLEPE